MSNKLFLQWSDFKDDLAGAFGILREDNDFADVTLACEDGKQFEAHKVILATSSPFFQNILKRNKHTHPLIYMRGLKSEDLSAIIDFLYFGEANVFQENLDSFLAIAEELQLKGLMGKYEDFIKRDQEVLPKSDLCITKDRNHKVQESKEYAPRLDKNKAEGAVAISGDISEDLMQLDAQIESMMELSQNLVSRGTYKAHTCKVCGKEGGRNDVRRHIEASHLEGLSFPCNLCEKICRSRNALRVHKQRNH